MSNLQKLQAKWYASLRKQGFKDIEDANGMLKTWTSSVRRASTAVNHTSYRLGQEEYYRLAAQFIWDKKFPSKLYKQVWTLHARGLTYGAIGKQLKLPKRGVRWRVTKMRDMFLKEKWNK